MKKCIKDCTFNEFTDWCNRRACDGRWSLTDAITCTEVIGEVYKIKPLFGKKKAREKKWEEIREEYLDPNAEIEI